MHIERVPNRNSPPAVLLRQSYREGGKVRKRTLANLSKLPDETIEGLRILLKGGQAIKNLEDAFEIIRTRPHGHVAAVLGTLRKIGLEQIIAAQPTRERNLVVAMIVAVEVFEGNIAAEAALDGIYVIRTSVTHELFDAGETVRAYKSLSTVERAFRSYKTSGGDKGFRGIAV